MSPSTAQKPTYMVTVFGPDEPWAVLSFKYEPQGVQPNGDAHRQPPKSLAVTARPVATGQAFDWSHSPDDPGADRAEIEAEIAARLQDRTDWLARITALVDQVEQWAKELDWSTRRIEKKLEDNRIGTHQVPALVMQYETFRVLLDPLGRSSPGTEGVVDLYLMPAWDDIARLFCEKGQWKIYSISAGHSRANDENPPPQLLSKESLNAHLLEMKRHAA